jgi:hypothetical protein
MKILRSAQLVFKQLVHGPHQLISIQRDLDDLKMLAATPLVNQIRSGKVYGSIQEAEFKVFSQFGDDGIIQYIIANAELKPYERRFIEFGVENYTESNTRFLLMNDNWSGLVIDGSQQNIDYIKNDAIYWKHDLTAVCSFIDRENINETFAANDFAGEIGLLSIDIDGNDYWIWESIDTVQPVLVIVEYNSVFGSKRAVTVPYDPAFNCTKAHPSNLFWGCSLRALYLLANQKGYAFVGSDSRGNNAYFVARNRLGNLRALTVEEGYVCSKFRESRNEEGNLTYVSGSNRLRIIEDMKVLDVETGSLLALREIL